MLTIFVIPCDDPKQADIDKLKKSLLEVACEMCVMEHRDINSMDKGTSEWYGYLFSNEWFDEGLRFALPYFLEKSGEDYLVLFKKVLEKKGALITPKIFQAPRIFRRDIELEGPGSLIPIHGEQLSSLKILDGFILEPHRLVQ
jgi:hypothetical protein